MLGFSPYDGYDMWNNKSFSKRYKKTLIYAQLHHIDDNLNDINSDDEKNLVFIPTKHPKDKNREIHYLTHRKISSYQGNENVEILRKIQQRLIFNSKIIKTAFIYDDPSHLDELIGWSEFSIEKIKKRLIDRNLEWTRNIEKLIPKERNSKKNINQSEKSTVIRKLIEMKEKC